MADSRIGWTALGLNAKGQTSIEFLFLFLIMLFYLQAVIQPAVTNSANSIIAVNRTGQARLGAMKLVNAINEVTALSGESSKTIWIFMDENTSIWCEEADNVIAYSASLGFTLGECNNSSECSGRIQAISDADLHCANFNVQKGSLTPKLKVRVWKDFDKRTHLQAPV